MWDFLTFRRMITPIIIQILFWASAIASVVAGIVSIVRGLDPQDAMQIGQGALLIVLGPWVARIYCEILILFFRMNQTLTDIRRNTQPNPAAQRLTQPLPR